MRLEAPSFYPLIQTWADMLLHVGENQASLSGDGFTYEITGAFSDLVLDWDATIRLPQNPNLAPGEYELGMVDDQLYAFRNQQRYLVPDGPVVVEVEFAPEED